MSSGDKVVCVTGGSGYIASWLVKSLLQRAYTVKATVRNPDDLKKTRLLRALEGADKRLNLFKADLLEEGSFKSAVSGCKAVFHTASPVLLSASDPQAWAKFPTIKRVVITSMAAVGNTRRSLTSGVVLDETWFSNPAIYEESKLWYQLSKTLAEKASWDFIKENGIDLVVIKIGHVIGPLLHPTVNLSAEIIQNLINGVKTTDLLCRLLGYQGKKMEGLGAAFTPLEVSVRDNIESLMEKGFPLV